MDFDRHKRPKVLRQVVKSLKRVRQDSSPGNVHKLRTRSRRLEAAIQALALEDEPRAHRLLKSVSRLRKKAGKVRALDVFIRFAAKLATPGQEDSLVQLLDHLGAKRQKADRKLHRAISDSGKSAKRQLKKCSSLFQPDGESPAEQQLKLVSAASELSTELVSWPRLSRANLHTYRLKVKELRYTLQLIDGSNAEVIGSLGELTDAIGEWHDWSELYTVASKLFEGTRRLFLLSPIRSTASAKLRHALSLAQAMQKRGLIDITSASMRHA